MSRSPTPPAGSSSIIPALILPDGPLGVAEAAVRDILSAAAERAELCQAKCRAERAEFADLAKTEFLATMSHELRTPLNAILGFAELLKNQSFGPLGSARYVGYAADIHDSGQLLLQIISDIMDVAKVETGRINLAPDWVDAEPPDGIGRPPDRTARRRRRPELRSRSAGAPLPRLWADERLIKQALLNVLSNAVKFTPSGGSIRMTAMVEPLSEKLEIEIADTGLGIAKSELIEGVRALPSRRRRHEPPVRGDRPRPAAGPLLRRASRRIPDARQHPGEGHDRPMSACFRRRHATWRRQPLR